MSKNNLLKLAAVATLGLGALGAAQAADVGVSLSIAEPGVYGRVDIGRYPGPALMQGQPTIVAPSSGTVAPEYLWVPEEHRLHWAQYCRRYEACGAPVYFVRDDWYHEHVVGAGHERRVERRDDRRDERRDERRDDRRDERRDDERR